MNRYKYPRTPHLPWSPSVGADDEHLEVTSNFEGRRVVITEKLDGENTTLYRVGMHARSIDGRHHPSRDWVKQFHGTFAHNIPNGWRLCGENVYARHSLAYDDLESYFFLFSVWNEENRCLSWDQTREWAALLGLVTPPILFEGVWDVAHVRDITIDETRCEGYVVRLYDEFEFADFGECVAKWVRTGHVQTNEHWMHAEIVPNKLK